ncbi:hypothetical protein AMELA_G00265990 [Ameiurus melas]|uniref:Uncharacterized protein n=1 Tax=Ameiurus melas TaxID=219545 RepID=A0A7J5ZQ40_AMEME|nr:hypothetical protein AMELA_G00265990 [Ameiurus melas]
MINPVTFLMTFACFKEMCLDKNSCRYPYGEMQMADHTGCIIKSCRKALQPCVFQTAGIIAFEMKKEDPSASLEDLWRQAAATVLKDLQSWLDCMKMLSTEGPMKATMCFLDAMLGDTQQHHNNGKPAFMSSDTDYMLCWMNTAAEGLMSCVEDYDLHTLRTLNEHFASNNGFFDCFLKMFPQSGRKCIPASMRFFGNGTLSKIAGSRPEYTEYTECADSWKHLAKECMYKAMKDFGSNPTISTKIKVSAHLHSRMINPVTFLMTFACLKEMCLDKNSCRYPYGEMQMADHTGCIIECCMDVLEPCALKTVDSIVTEMKKADPSAYTNDLWEQAGAYLRCVQN